MTKSHFQMTHQCIARQFSKLFRVEEGRVRFVCHRQVFAGSHSCVFGFCALSAVAMLRREDDKMMEGVMLMDVEELE